MENKADSSTILHDLLEKVAPKLSSSKTLRESSLPTRDEISQQSFGRWPTSGMAWRGECLTVDTFGVPQSRTRVFICGFDGDPEAAARVLFEPECGDRNFEKSRSHGETPAASFKKVVGDPERGYAKELAHCVYAEGPKTHRNRLEQKTMSHTLKAEKYEDLHQVKSERLQGFPTGWTDIYDNTDDSKRYHACGNAVTVPVIAWIANRMVKVLNACDQPARENSPLNLSR